MFERYTERARRVIFFSRYEASQFGSPYIETEHVLLGLLREDKALTNRFLHSHASVESIRKQIEAHTTIREKVSTSVDLPLSDECKRVLAYAAEEAERLGHEHIGTEHLLLGLLREEKCFASEILQERGLKLTQVRDDLVRVAHEKASQAQRQRESSVLAEFSRDLTDAAMDGQLDPLVGREKEIESLIEVLCSRINRNALLIHEHGVASITMVELLAQRIAECEVPTFLENKRLLALDLEQMVEGGDNKLSKERLESVMKELGGGSFIVFIDEIKRLAQLDTRGILKRALLNGEVQCIGACTADDYDQTFNMTPWLNRCFRAIRIPPMLESDITRTLFARKDLFEKFHAVSYTDEAIEYAGRLAVRYFAGGASFDKAMELLDAAGTRIKLRQSAVPEEIIEVQKRIKFILRRMGSSIANHEFEKARFYSDEERNERENLRMLREKHHIDVPAGIIREGDIAEVVSRWTGIPIALIGGGGPGEDTNANAHSSLRVFMCHAAEDKPTVRQLYQRLKQTQIKPWLDEEEILAGQEWRYQIEKAVRSTHIVLVCLSAHSVSKTGFVHKEIRIALDVADEQPEGAIFVVPLKLEQCDVPDRLRHWHWVNLYEKDGFEKLMRALVERARNIGIGIQQDKPNQ